MQINQDRDDLVGMGICCAFVCACMCAVCTQAQQVALPLHLIGNITSRNAQSKSIFDPSSAGCVCDTAGHGGAAELPSQHRTEQQTHKNTPNTRNCPPGHCAHAHTHTRHRDAATCQRERISQTTICVFHNVFRSCTHHHHHTHLHFDCRASSANQSRSLRDTRVARLTAHNPAVHQPGMEACR
jgi:hypothetical protein